MGCNPLLTRGSGKAPITTETAAIRALFDLIESDRRPKPLFATHHLVDPRFAPVG